MKKLMTGILIFACMIIFAAPSLYTSSGALHTIGALIDEQRFTFNIHFNGALKDFDTTFVSTETGETLTAWDTYGLGGLKFGLGYSITNWIELGFVSNVLLDGIETPLTAGRPNSNVNYGSFGLGNTQLNLKLTTGRFFGKMDNGDIGIFAFYNIPTGIPFSNVTDSASFLSRDFMQNSGGIVRRFSSGNNDFGAKLLLSYKVLTAVPITIDLNGGYTYLTGMPASMEQGLIDFSTALSFKLRTFVPFIEFSGYKYTDPLMFDGNLITFFTGGIRFDTPSGIVIDIGSDFRLIKFTPAIEPVFNTASDSILYNDGWASAANWTGHFGLSYYYDFKKKSVLNSITVIEKTILTGKVIDKENGAPLHAMITLITNDNDIKLMTDSEGLYTVEIESGAIRVKAEKQGFQFEDKGIVIEKGKTQVLDFALLSSKVEKSIITGRVIDKTNDKIVMAKISVPSTEITDIYPEENGTYKIALYAGTYTINATAEGFIAYSLPIEVGENQTIMMDIELLKKGGKINLKGIYFESGKADLLTESYTTLNNALKLLKSNPKVKFEIHGHTDSVGSDKDNQLLSEARAEAVRSYLIKNGVNSERMVAKGFGELMPIATNNTSEGRAENRRIEFLILGE